MKARKVHEMAADIFAFHADRVLGLELTPALFGFVVDDVDTFRELFSPVADRENDVRVSHYPLLPPTQQQKALSLSFSNLHSFYDYRKQEYNNLKRS